MKRSDGGRERDEREVHIRGVKHVLFKQRRSQTDSQSCYRDVRRAGESSNSVAIFTRSTSSFMTGLYGLLEVYGPLVVCVALSVVFIKVTGPHGGVRRDQGAGQELQPLLLRKLQSGKKPEREGRGSGSEGFRVDGL